MGAPLVDWSIKDREGRWGKQATLHLPAGRAFDRATNPPPHAHFCGPGTSDPGERLTRATQRRSLSTFRMLVVEQHPIGSTI